MTGLLLALLIGTSCGAIENPDQRTICYTLEGRAVTFAALADQVRQYPGQRLAGVIPGRGVVGTRAWPLETTSPYWIGPIDTRGACDGEEGCSEYCSGACARAGHGSQTCNVAMTPRPGGGQLCSAGCGQENATGGCANTPAASCYAECIPVP